MIRFMCRRALRQFSDRYQYDVAYLGQLLHNSLSAFLRFSLLKLVSGYRAGIPVAPWFAASIRATLWEDCGPCVQLVSNMALEAGVEPAIVEAVVSGDFDKLPQDVALTARFTELALAHDANADDLRDQVIERWGQDGLISVAFTISASRVYPTLKYILGHGRACSRIHVGQKSVVPALLNKPQVISHR